MSRHADRTDARQTPHQEWPVRHERAPPGTDYDRYCTGTTAPVPEWYCTCSALQYLYIANAAPASYQHRTSAMPVQYEHSTNYSTTAATIQDHRRTNVALSLRSARHALKEVCARERAGPTCRPPPGPTPPAAASRARTQGEATTHAQAKLPARTADPEIGRDIEPGRSRGARQRMGR